MASCGIAIMAKASAPGQTKTRLVPPLTFDQAAALNTAFVQDIADNVLLAGRHSAIAGYVAFAPRGSEDFFRGILPPAIGLIDACLPTLGDCLVRTVEEVLARGHQSAVVLNSDSPTLPTAVLVETAQALAQPGERAVLGPSSDGGYYLLGLKRRITGYSRTSPGAPSASPRRRASGRARLSSTCTRCRSGTMSTTSKACAGCVAKYAGCAPPNIGSIQANRIFPPPPRR